MSNQQQKTKILYYPDNSNVPHTLELNQVKQYKFNLYQLRKNIITKIKNSSCAVPHYHIILSYYQKHRHREIITKQHRFIRNRMEECFNPRYRGCITKSSYFFFIERHKRKLISSDGNTYYFFNQIKTDNQVLNTQFGYKEYDEVDKEISNGAFHSHILKSEINDLVMSHPNKKLQKVLKKATGLEYIPLDVTTTELQQIKIDCIKEICRESSIVGNGKAGTEVVTVNPKYQYDGFYGYEGFIAYATKTCYNPDRMAEVIDGSNSSIHIRSSTIPIEELNKRVVIPEDNEYS